jgi:hypothetical protein
MAANNILNEEPFSIQDYYNKNIKGKRQMKDVIEEEQ